MKRQYGKYYIEQFSTVDQRMSACSVAWYVLHPECRFERRSRHFSESQRNGAQRSCDICHQDNRWCKQMDFQSLLGVRGCCPCHFFLGIWLQEVYWVYLTNINIQIGGRLWVCWDNADNTQYTLNWKKTIDPHQNQTRAFYSANRSSVRCRVCWHHWRLKNI